ncbi:MAG: hypothetical protein U9P10_01980 [Thermodesulfobacteriota bacterium]|nr:hypothetical protein [Thermodesulfobacteriota bacterium]
MKPILRRETHFDQLADKLKEERVKNIIGPILHGEPNISSLPDDDIAYCKDLGLIKQTAGLIISNPIYGEIIPRQLTYSTQQTIIHETLWYLDKDGKITYYTRIAGSMRKPPPKGALLWESP